MIIFLSMTFSLVSCDDPSDPLSLNIFTLEDDVQLGKELDVQIRSNPAEYPLLESQTANQYVQSMVDTIIASDKVKNKDIFEYKTQIIHNDSIVNAFAAPGGFIYVYTGLLKFVDDEATLAAILAHEVAHTDLRHASTRMTKQYGISFLLSLLIGDNPSQFEEIAANLLSGLALLKNSREDEFEADEHSFLYLQTSIWYPGGISFFFTKIDDNQGSTFIDEWLSTHPMPEDRVAAVEKMINDAGIPEPTEENLRSAEYAAFIKTLP